MDDAQSNTLVVSQAAFARVLARCDNPQPPSEALVRLMAKRLPPPPERLQGEG